MLEGMFILAILIEVVFPVILAFWAVKKLGVTWAMIGMGAIAFIFSQLIHIPLVGALQSVLVLPFFSNLPSFISPWVIGLFYGLLAGICEEPSRWLAFKFMREKGEKPNNAIALGIGHGGIESILFVGLTVLANFVLMLLIRNGSVTIPEVTPDMVTQYFGNAWYAPLSGAIERLSTICLHLGMSLMVWKAVRYHSWKWILGAILIHTFYDMTAVALSALGVNVWIIEGIYALLGAASIYWIIQAIRNQEPYVEAETIPAS